MINSAVFSFYQIARFYKVKINHKVMNEVCVDKNGRLRDDLYLKIVEAAGFRASYAKIDLESFDSRIFPLIAIANDGNYFILAGIIDGKYLVLFSNKHEIQELSREEFNEIYSGEVLYTIHKSFFKTLQQNKILSFLWKYQWFFGNLFVWRIDGGRDFYYAYVLL